MFFKIYILTVLAIVIIGLTIHESGTDLCASMGHMKVVNPDAISYID